jgi:uncharacterized RDD family membrane protein YckC
MTMTEIPPGMGRCEITGKIVPLDELVTLNGQRVCAEGKVILLERLKAGEVLPGEAERPTVLRRFGCIFLDGIILLVPLTLINVGAGVVVGASGAGSGGLIVAGIAQLVGVCISLAYFTMLHGSRGQSVGKMAGKLKVVRIDGQPMDMKTAFIRALGYQGLGLISAFLVMTAIVPLQLVGSLIVSVYGLANAIAALVDRSQQRAIHDRIAGTRVVMLQS